MGWDNWVSSVANVVVALGLIFVWLQVRLLQKQIKADHERSRRELTINLLRDWDRAVTPQMVAAEKLVASLPKEKCIAIVRNEPIEISIYQRDLLEAALEGLATPDEILENDGKIKLCTRYVGRLRYLVAGYLNALEALFAAWSLSVVDRKTIEQQFQFLVRPYLDHDALRKFREAMGGNETYPATEAFTQFVEKNYSKSSAISRERIA